MAGKSKKETQKQRDDISQFDIANFLHSRRTPKAIAVDNGSKARITKNIGLWVAQPNRFDFEGIDTPKGSINKKPIKTGAGKVIASRFGVKV
jgi:hypothetical protein